MTKNKTKILVIDDDPKVSWILKEGLSEHAKPIQVEVR